MIKKVYDAGLKKTLYQYQMEYTKKEEFNPYILKTSGDDFSIVELDKDLFSYEEILENTKDKLLGINTNIEKHSNKKINVKSFFVIRDNEAYICSNTDELNPLLLLELMIPIIKEKYEL